MAHSFHRRQPPPQLSQTPTCRTRGQILLKLQRWKEAIPNLEVALEAKELRSAIYPSLAKAYAQIGAPEMTQLYQDLAKGD
jgi:predicted Zn-dependent protease